MSTLNQRIRDACTSTAETLRQIEEGATLLVTFDNGQTWQEVGAVGGRVWDMVEHLKANSPLPGKTQVIFSAMSMSSSFLIKPKKPRKTRQTPPFWSAYK